MHTFLDIQVDDAQTLGNVSYGFEKRCDVARLNLTLRSFSWLNVQHYGLKSAIVKMSGSRTAISCLHFVWVIF